MKASGRRAADLTRQLLAYAGKGRFVLNAISLSCVLVQEISSLVRASFPAHVRLELELDPALPAIEADPAQIQQIIMNLLLNAAESIPADRKCSGMVTVAKLGNCTSDRDRSRMTCADRLLPSSRPCNPERFAALEVVDNGLGMDATTQARIFEPFFTTKFTGRGLGLSAVLGIVASYQGALTRGRGAARCRDQEHVFCGSHAGHYRENPMRGIATPRPSEKICAAPARSWWWTMSRCCHWRSPAVRWSDPVIHGSLDRRRRAAWRRWRLWSRSAHVRSGLVVLRAGDVTMPGMERGRSLSSGWKSGDPARCAGDSLDGPQ